MQKSIETWETENIRHCPHTTIGIDADVDCSPAAPEEAGDAALASGGGIEVETISTSAAELGSGCSRTLELNSKCGPTCTGQARVVVCLYPQELLWGDFPTLKTRVFYTEGVILESGRAYRLDVPSGRRAGWHLQQPRCPREELAHALSRLVVPSFQPSRDSLRARMVREATRWRTHWTRGQNGQRRVA